MPRGKGRVGGGPAWTAVSHTGMMMDEKVELRLVLDGNEGLVLVFRSGSVMKPIFLH